MICTTWVVGAELNDWYLAALKSHLSASIIILALNSCWHWNNLVGLTKIYHTPQKDFLLTLNALFLPLRRWSFHIIKIIYMMISTRVKSRWPLSTSHSKTRSSVAPAKKKNWRIILSYIVLLYIKIIYRTCWRKLPTLSHSLSNHLVVKKIMMCRKYVKKILGNNSARQPPGGEKIMMCWKYVDNIW